MYVLLDGAQQHRVFSEYNIFEISHTCFRFLSTVGQFSAVGALLLFRLLFGSIVFGWLLVILNVGQIPVLSLGSLLFLASIATHFFFVLLKSTIFLKRYSNITTEIRNLVTAFVKSVTQFSPDFFFIWQIYLFHSLNVHLRKCITCTRTNVWTMSVSGNGTRLFETVALAHSSHERTLNRKSIYMRVCRLSCLSSLSSANKTVDCRH